MKTRSHLSHTNDEADYYKIQTRGTRWSHLVVPDRSSPILMNGNLTEQVGAFWVRGDEAFLKFSRSEKGQSAMSAYACGGFNRISLTSAAARPVKPALSH